MQEWKIIENLQNLIGRIDMAGFDSNTADISVILDAYMYLDYQSDSEEIQEKSLNEILEKIEKKYKDNENYKALKKPVRKIRVLENIHWSVRAIMSMRQMDRISSIIQEKNVQMIRYRHAHSKVRTGIYMWHTEEPVLKMGR